MTDEETHDALVKMAREHIAATPRSAVMDLPKERRMPEMDLTGGGAMQMPEMDLTGSDNIEASEPVVRRGPVRTDAPSARVPPKISVTLGKPEIHELDSSSPGPRLSEEDLESKPAPDNLGPRGALAKLATGAGMPPRPPVDTSAPLGWRPPPRGAPPVDTELRGLQADAGRRHDIASVGQAVTDFTERPSNFLDYAQRLGGGGVSAPPAKSTRWKDYEQEGAQALEELKARRAGDSALASQQDAAAEKNEDTDPESGKAQLLRATLAKYAPDLAPQLAGRSFRQMAPIAGPELAKMIEAQAAANKPPKATDPLEQAKLDETIRHNKAVEALPHGKAAGSHPPAPPVQPGKYESIADPGERETVRAIVEGRAPAPAPGSKNGQHIMGLVAQVAPDFDSTKYASYQHTRTEQATNPSINAAKAVTHHMELLKKAVDELPEETIDSPTINRVGQALHGMVGSDKYTAMQTEAKIVAAELAQALGEKDVEGRAMVQHLVRPEQTKAQWAKSIAALEQLRDEKLGVYRETLKDLSPSKAASSAPVAPKSAGVTITDKKGQRYENVPPEHVEDLKAELESAGLL